jgi:hypothetical protein
MPGAVNCWLWLEYNVTAFGAMPVVFSGENVKKVDGEL